MPHNVLEVSVNAAKPFRTHIRMPRWGALAYDSNFLHDADHPTLELQGPVASSVSIDITCIPSTRLGHR